MARQLGGGLSSADCALMEEKGHEPADLGPRAAARAKPTVASMSIAR
jgi:hypothetical protein